MRISLTFDFGRNEPTILTHILLYIKIHFKANKNAPFLTLFSVNFLKRRFFAVEPFGLFQFLQSFLSQTPENTPKAEEPNAINPDKRSDEFAPSPAKPKAESTTEPQTRPEADSSNQAILSFMQAHETRAKRIKKT